jgi:glycyl-tRNA synthetase beta chain
MDKADFLFELGTEELPSKSLLQLMKRLQESLCQQLTEKNLAYGAVQPYATPRRLALIISDLQTIQSDCLESRRGPKANATEQAIAGFARSCQVTVTQLQIIDTNKGHYYQFKKRVEGQPTANLLPQMIEKALADLPIAKRMRWGSSREEFVRPVQWFILMLGEQLIESRLFGLNNGNTSFGHRAYGGKNIIINSPSTYVEQLRNEGFVVVDFFERKQIIEQQLHEQAIQVNAEAVIDAALLDEVTGLVEWPVCFRGRFDKSFLSIPSEALVSSMKVHQKYFHLVDHQGTILPYFITVSNVGPNNPNHIIAGNERVIRPRLADAAFFYESDKKHNLASRNNALSTVIFQEQLGSVLVKTERIAMLAQNIAERVGSDGAKAARAGHLCKADLNSDMVLEFSELQGIMGHHYALSEGEDPLVSAALEQHYWPRFSGDQLPQNPTATAVALADRLDTLVGLFGIGKPPTGTKDPFALRRASIGVIRIIIELELELDLQALIKLSYILHAKQNVLPLTLKQVSDQLLTFIFERLRSYYEDQDISVEAYLAVLAQRNNSALDFDRRIKAVSDFMKQPEAADLAATTKRVSSILCKNATGQEQLQLAKLQEPSEIKLAEALTDLQNKSQSWVVNGKYSEMLQALANLAEPLQQFFTSTMVMDEDTSIRDNRLALLTSLQQQLSLIADMSLLAVVQQ